jgi:hypothetical protein
MRRACTAMPGGFLGPDGKIVFVSYNADNIGVFDPSNRSFTTIDIADKISSGSHYYGGVLGPDGKIVFVSRTANNIGVLELGNQDLAYEVSGVNPKAWSALLSHNLKLSQLEAIMISRDGTGILQGLLSLGR